MEKRILFGALVCTVLVPIAAHAQTPTPTPEATAVATATPAPVAVETPMPAPPPPAAVWSAKPTGMIAVVGSYNDRGVNNIDLPLFATDIDPTDEDVPTAAASARGTRIGLSIYPITGGTVAGAKVNGVFEADFFGGMPGQTLGDVSPLTRMRLAYAKADWTNTTVVMGQNWSVFAPLNPKSVSRTFLPEFQASGNLYMREPMLSVTQRAGPASLALAIVAPLDSTVQGGAIYSQVNAAGPGELSASPAAEGRLAVSKKLVEGQLGLDFGASGRYGTEKIAAILGKNIPATGYALDGKISWGSMVWVQGEAFTGQNLDTYFALEGTQVLVTGTGSAAVAALAPQSIATTGGWLQVGVAHGPFEISGGYGDQTLDRDDIGNGNNLVQNQTWTAAFTWRPAPTFAVGLEYNYIETTRRANGSAPFVNAIARHVDVGMTLAF